MNAPVLPNAALAPSYRPIPIAPVGSLVVGALVPAPSSARLWAVVVDHTMHLIVAVGLGAVCGLMGLGVEGVVPEAPAIGWGAGLLLGFLGFFVAQIYGLATVGQTLGKRWVGIRIVKTNGERVGFVDGWLVRNGFVRLAECVLGPLVPVFWIVNIAMLGTENGRTLHDRISGTRVVVV